MKKSKKTSTENCHFYSLKKPQYITWACFRNVTRIKPIKTFQNACKVKYTWSSSAHRHVYFTLHVSLSYFMSWGETADTHGHTVLAMYLNLSTVLLLSAKSFKTTLLQVYIYHAFKCIQH